MLFCLYMDWVQYGWIYCIWTLFDELGLISLCLAFFLGSMTIYHLLQMMPLFISGGLVLTLSSGSCRWPLGI